MNRKSNGNARKGFASMSVKQRTKIAAMGGAATVAKLGSKHMAKIGSIGGSCPKVSCSRTDREA